MLWGDGAAGMEQRAYARIYRWGAHVAYKHSGMQPRSAHLLLLASRRLPALLAAAGALLCTRCCWRLGRAALGQLLQLLGACRLLLLLLSRLLLLAVAAARCLLALSAGCRTVAAAQPESPRLLALALWPAARRRRCCRLCCCCCWLLLGLAALAAPAASPQLGLGEIRVGCRIVIPADLAVRGLLSRTCLCLALACLLLLLLLLRRAGASGGLGCRLRRGCLARLLLAARRLLLVACLLARRGNGLSSSGRWPWLLAGAGFVTLRRRAVALQEACAGRAREVLCQRPHQLHRLRHLLGGWREAPAGRW